MKYSPSTNCFYPDELGYSTVPADAVETTCVIYGEWCASAFGSTIKMAGDGTLTITPPPAVTLAQAQTTQIATLNAAYTAAIGAPVSFKTAGGTTATFPQSDTAKRNLTSCITAGAGAWSLNLWLDVNGQPVTPFTYADLQGLAAAMEAVEAPDFQQLLSLIAQVTAATTVAAVQAIVWPVLSAPA